MSIIGVRIDGRLIHGQVANLWATIFPELWSLMMKLQGMPLKKAA